ncbi:MAG: hypothetical protein ACSLFB_12925 [Acidimicrobiales bacterium]
MIGAFLATLAGKMALAGTVSAAAVGSLGASGALPGPIQSALSSSMGVIGIHIPSPTSEADLKAKQEPSLKLTATSNTSLIEESTIPKVDTYTLMAQLNLGIEVAFWGEPTPDAAYQAARAHIDAQCNQALMGVTEQFAKLVMSLNGRFEMTAKLDESKQKERSKIKDRCIKALALADEYRAQVNPGMPRDLALSPLPNAPLPTTLPSPREVPITLPVPNNPSDTTVPKSPGSTIPNIPTTTVPSPNQPDDTIPDGEYSGPGSGYDGDIDNGPQALLFLLKTRP